MKIIHTADIHLDACFADSVMPAAVGNRRRQSLRDALTGILQRAADWPADAVLIAGDLFDQEHASPDTTAFLRDAFAAIAPVPILIAPGNHDPYTPESPYASATWPENVVVYTRPEWAAYEVPGAPLTVHGFAFDGPDLSVNPFGRLEVPLDGRVHVAVAHGSEMGCIAPDKGAYGPFQASAAAAKGLSYLALGHYHGYKTIEGPFSTRMCYSGSPEGHNFKETGIHYFLEVAIESGQVEVTPVASSQVVYAVHSLDCSDFAHAQQVVEALRALARGEERPQIARVIFTGTFSPEWYAEMSALRDAVAPEFEYLDLVDRMHAPEDYEGLARENTSLGAFVARLNKEIEDAADGQRCAVLERAREVGMAAYRDRALPILGIGEE